MLSFSGHKDPDTAKQDGIPAYQRVVTITMDCATPNATIFYTTDGVSTPSENSENFALPGTEVQWAEEGKSTFMAAAFAEGMYQSDVASWDVFIVAPRLEEHDLPATGSSAADGKRTE